jgi:hypothetical protein
LAGDAYGALKRKLRELQASLQDMGVKIGFPRGGGKRRKRLIAITRLTREGAPSTKRLRRTASLQLASASPT